MGGGVRKEGERLKVQEEGSGVEPGSDLDLDLDPDPAKYYGSTSGSGKIIRIL